jgi:Ca-activated chloride channel family protein
MYWENPSWLLLWWLLPAMAGVVLHARRRRKAAALQFADAGILGRLLPAASPVRDWLKTTAMLLASALLIAGLARPRWGANYEKIQARGVDLFVLLDVSRSMLAEDVSPNRLERAKSDIRDLMTHLAGDRVGLIVFAGAAIVKVPLTTDHAFFLTALDDVDPSSAPRGGSLIGDAIRKALESLPPRADRDQVLVVITDGEDHDSFPAEAARHAAERGVKIFTVGLGDAGSGHPIPIRDQSGNQSFVQQDGQEVLSKMDEKLLKEIALTTGGAYVPARTRAYDLGVVYRDHLSPLTRGEISAEKRKRHGERFQIFLLAGFVLLLLESLVPRYSRGTVIRQ